ncbi:glycosyltransferase family 2 protein [Meinhardsimonia xiamenensis]|uniref:glycosyltransferase family 2 protein n=1 Tax=Meinhardsimonia xiamenensis TaxID=990712 RepID=UPI000B860AC4|nr:glycosyltransferase [Meinhardsimonia xiamenensis]
MSASPRGVPEAAPRPANSSTPPRRLARADLLAQPPEPRLVEALGPALCLRLGMLPLRRAGRETLVATADPERLAARRRMIETALGPVRPILAAPRDIEEALRHHFGATLARAAEAHVPEPVSCRALAGAVRPLEALAWLQLFGAVTLVAPKTVLAALTALAVTAMLLATALKLAAALAALAPPRPRPGEERGPLVLMPERPMVSVIVPLFREASIAGALIERLCRVRYPRNRLEICFAVEEDDDITRAALERADLPAWMRAVIVPGGSVRTKPRALNFVLDFCRGEIIGVWDAEDAPAPDQIEKVVSHLHRAPAEVAGVQGVLDFYNSGQNWLTRCFTIEYATWFRLVLPGLARLGLVVPLGGTTLFFRRPALEEMGRWDAHNVTEDADLGVRLARFGYRVELLDTVTTEEAASSPSAWIRQRSRWLKGYAVTWGVHMRAPRRLLRELGWWRFMGFQVLFLGTVIQFALQPFLWSFWLILFGLPHPLDPMLSAPLGHALWAGFLTCEAINLSASAAALWRAGRQRRALVPWAPLLHVYYLMASVAVAKGLWEVIHRPFFWDKTEHGRVSPRRRRGRDVTRLRPRSRRA